MGGTRSIGQDTLTLTNGALAASAPLVVAKPLAVTANTVNAVLADEANDITLAGGVTGDGALIVNGPGTVSIGGSSSFMAMFMPSQLRVSTWQQFWGRLGLIWIRPVKPQVI